MGTIHFHHFHTSCTKNYTRANIMPTRKIVAYVKRKPLSQMMGEADSEAVHIFWERTSYTIAVM
jgi:hypothetical protein